MTETLYNHDNLVGWRQPWYLRSFKLEEALSANYSAKGTTGDVLSGWSLVGHKTKTWGRQSESITIIGPACWAWCYGLRVKEEKEGLHRKGGDYLSLLVPRRSSLAWATSLTPWFFLLDSRRLNDLIQPGGGAQVATESCWFSFSHILEQVHTRALMVILSNSLDKLKDVGWSLFILHSMLTCILLSV